MRILALDVATKTGWALYDTNKPVSSIQSGSFNIENANTIVDKLWAIRNGVPPLMREHQPDYVVVEAPLNFAPQYEKKPKRDMITQVEPQQTSEAPRSTISPNTISELSQMAGCATGVVMGFNVDCCQVRPQDWQRIIPRDIYDRYPTWIMQGSKKKKDETATKKRVKDFCDRLHIASPNMDSRDACIIAVWGSTQSKQLKIAEMAHG